MAKWIQQESPYGYRYNCSECGHEVCVPCSDMIDQRDYYCYLDKYCGECGAKMNDHVADASKKVGVDNAK